jgi:hypothetical protein
MDQVFLDQALSASEELLVSGDADLFALHDQQTVPVILDPARFRVWLQQHSLALQGPWARSSPKSCLIPRPQVPAGGSIELEAFLPRQTPNGGA